MSAKFEYQFVSVPHKHGSVAYQDAAHKVAKEGWRLVQILVEVPAVIPSAHVLILERPLP